MVVDFYLLRLFMRSQGGLNLPTVSRCSLRGNLKGVGKSYIINVVTKFARADRTARVESRETWDYVKFPHACAHIGVVLVCVYSSASSTLYADKHNTNGAP